MNVSVDIKIVDNLPINELNKYIDLVVFGVARNTLDYTTAENRFPYLTGNLQRSAIAEGVKQEEQFTYYLGAAGADYAEYVWEFPQNTNWTNPNTYAQWYFKVFQNKKEVITQNAVDNAIRSVK